MNDRDLESYVAESQLASNARVRVCWLRRLFEWFGILP